VTILAFALSVVAALWVFTAVETRRIEARYPPTGTRVDVGGGAIHALDRPQRGEPRGAVSLEFWCEILDCVFSMAWRSA
jgi:hypothetical protein